MGKRLGEQEGPKRQNEWSREVGRGPPQGRKDFEKGLEAEV